MLDHIFSSDNAVFRTINAIGYIWYLNILWVICSLPVITIGASTSALVYSCLKLRNQEGYVTKNFFKSFRENLKQATILFVLYALVGVVLVLDLILGKGTEGGVGQVVRMGAFVLLFPYCMSLLYVFAIQSKFVNTIKNTIFYSFVLAIRHFKLTLQMLILVGGVVYLNCTFLLANYITLSIGIGFLGYFLSAYYNRIFADYIPTAQGEAATVQETLVEEADADKVVSVKETTVVMETSVEVVVTDKEK